MDAGQLWLDNQGLVKRMTTYLTYKWSGFIDKSDVEDEVQWALFKAIQSFNPAKNVKFSSWAVRLMKQHVQRKIDHVIVDMERSYEHQDLGSAAWSLRYRKDKLTRKSKAVARYASVKVRLSDRKKKYFSDKECSECNSTNDLLVMHPTVTPGVIWSVSQEKRDRYLSESVVLCRECHLDQKYPDRHTHGTVSMYVHRGCRCNKCKEAYKNGRKK